MPRLALAALTSFALLAVVGACSGSSSRSERDSRGGDAGQGGTAGSSAGAGGANVSGSAGTSSGGAQNTGGDAGTSGTGTSGSMNTGGTAGAGALGGTAGASPGGNGGAGMGGEAGGGRECETADDCVRITSCCDCAAAPAGTTPPSCPLLCAEDRCFAAGIGPDDVTCAFGRCVIDRSCDHARATCDETPQPCPEDEQVRFLDDGCFGGCIAPTECRDVTDCTSCGNAVCVLEEALMRTVGCVDPGPSCTKGNYCECLEACPTSGFVCMEADDAVHCPCPAC